MKILYVSNHTIYIGESKSENWDILTRASQTDVFFHLSSFPSCYVILQSTNRAEPTNDTLLLCARTCLEHTKFKAMKNIYVDYTSVSNVVKADTIGEIVYKSRRKVHKIMVE